MRGEKNMQVLFSLLPYLQHAAHAALSISCMTPGGEHLSFSDLSLISSVWREEKLEDSLMRPAEIYRAQRCHAMTSWRDLWSVFGAFSSIQYKIHIVVLKATSHHQSQHPSNAFVLQLSQSISSPLSVTQRQHNKGPPKKYPYTAERRLSGNRHLLSLAHLHASPT